MRKRTAIAVMIVSLFFINSATSEDAGRPPQEYGRETDNRSGFILPQEFAKQSDAINKMIEDKNEFEFIRQSQPIVEHNKDGTVNWAIYDDGTKVAYSYVRGDDGKLRSLSLESHDWKIVINNGDASGVEESNTLVYTNENMYVVYEEPKNEGGKQDIPDNSEAGKKDQGVKKPDSAPENKPTIIFYPKKKINLEIIARKPVKFDFKEINKVIHKAESLKANAALEYAMNSKQYYDNVERELVSRGLIDNKVNATGDIERRQDIDKAVETAYRSYEKEASDSPVRDFVIIEKVLRREVMVPAKEIYRDRMGVMQECLVRIIDQIIESKLAIYLNLDPSEDKIDAVISLQDSAE